MMNKLKALFVTATLMAVSIGYAARPIKVFILAGQSNMQGHAHVSTIPSMADDPKTANLLKQMQNPDGTYKVCDRVWISSVGCAGDGYADVIEQTGKLSVGFGASTQKIGPEYTFGLRMQEKLREPILIIKTSWGGRNLHTDFRPPSAGHEEVGAYKLEQWKRRKLNVDEEMAKMRQGEGVFYRHMIDHVRNVLGNIGRVVPGYDAKQGYEIAGFVWFQGFNDVIDDWTYPDRMKPGGYGEYARLLSLLIQDVRKDLNAPKLPFVIGVMGIGGDREGAKPPHSNFRAAQASVATMPEFVGNASAVSTSPFWDDALEDLQNRRDRLNRKLDDDFKKEPDLNERTKSRRRQTALEEEFTESERKKMLGMSNGGYHYLGAAKILAPIGQAFADSMLALMRQRSRSRG